MRQKLEDHQTEPTVSFTNPGSLVVEPEPVAAVDSSHKVDRLLGMVRKRTRLQTLYRSLAAAIAAPPVALFLFNVTNAYQYFPWVSNYSEWINPLFTTRTHELSWQNVNGQIMWTNWNHASYDFLTPCILALVCFGLIALAYRQRAHLTRELAEYDDVRSVGALTDALGLRGAARSAAATALIRLLPRLRASEAGLLNDSHRDRLRQEILGRNEELANSVLKAYEQVGDARDLSIVEKIGRGIVKTSAGVKNAAENCLPYLRQRVQTAATLLRPAAEAMTAPLLIPAASASTTPPESLLRPSDI